MVFRFGFRTAHFVEMCGGLVAAFSGYYQYIKDSKVEICRGGRLMIADETIAVEAIAVEVITSSGGVDQ